MTPLLFIAKKKKAENEAAAEHEENGESGIEVESYSDQQPEQTEEQTEGSTLMVSHEGEVSPARVSHVC